MRQQVEHRVQWISTPIEAEVALWETLAEILFDCLLGTAEGTETVSGTSFVE